MAGFWHHDNLRIVVVLHGKRAPHSGGLRVQFSVHRQDGTVARSNGRPVLARVLFEQGTRRLETRDHIDDRLLHERSPCAVFGHQSTELLARIPTVGEILLTGVEIEPKRALNVLHSGFVVVTDQLEDTGDLCRVKLAGKT